jgi:hypothetical protein
MSWRGWIREPMVDIDKGKGNNALKGEESIKTIRSEIFE